MPPNSPAIWLAESPSAQSFLSSSTRSSVHVMSRLPSTSWRHDAGRIPPRSPARGRPGLRPHNGTQGTVRYEMSYPTQKTLQYGWTHAQESGRLTSTFFVCQMSIILNKAGDSRGEAIWRLVDTAVL